jgi:hypothetical protein
LLSTGFLTVSAQSEIVLTEGTTPLVYSLPKTELCFDVEIVKTVQTPGVFYLYSQRYLSTDQVILEEKVNYRVKNIEMTTRTLPDEKRRFQVAVKGISALNKIQVDESGILTGINIPAEKNKEAKNREIKREIILKNSNHSDLLPLTQEYMLAGSTAKLAEGAAKQIYMIRESRLNLLTGETEQMPQDGAALKTMLEGLDKQENELTELFTGSVQTEVLHFQVKMIPEKVNTEEVLFRVSSKRGLVDKDDLGGEPFYINLNAEVLKVAEPDPKAKIEKVGLYTILPALTNISIGNGIDVMLNKKVFLPQLGVLIPIPERVFKSTQVKLRIDANTGRVIGFE